MKTLTFFALLVWAVASCLNTLAQKQYTLSGFVYDEQTNNPLLNATIYIEEMSYGKVVDDKGHFQFSLAPRSYTLLVSLVGYEKQKLNINLSASLELQIKLKPQVSGIDEVVITANAEDQQIKETETGFVEIDKKELETLPYLLGEVDPIRILQLMPGVKTGGEGNTGFYVRGGAVDQNLIMLDNSIVYNPSHLFGFFSIFNGNAIDKMEMYKGGIPAYYGGRLSSFTKVSTRNGDPEKVKGEAGIGLIATNFLVEGPIKKNKGTFLIAGRRTYIDLFINPLRELFSVKERINYHFYDLNINASLNLSPADKLTFKAYNGSDNFKFSTGSSFSNRIKWGNTTGSLQWIHRFNENLHGELTASTVLYDLDFGAGINTYNFDIRSTIWDKSLTYQLDFKKGKHNVVFGLNYTHHTLKPNNMEAHSDSVELDLNANVRLKADEASIYINDKISITEQLEVNAGLRLAGFRQLGPFTRYIVDDELQILDTINYNSGKIVSYGNLEPRLSFRYSLAGTSSLKASYDRSYQYIHMTPFASASLPIDVWVPSSTEIKPQSAHQYAAGYFRNFKNNNIETSFVLYYKTMDNQLEYRDGVILGYSKGFNYDDNFVFGKGTSYGAEMFLKKNRGTINGFISYTLSKTTRTFKELNSGKSFPAKYDRLHDVSAMVNYKHNSQWTFSSVFVYGTGNALNLPIARYFIQGNVINEYGSRNAFRMPAYHRLDLAATYHVPKKKFDSYWVFSLYNVYNRRNPYYIYFENKGDIREYKLKTGLKEVSLFPVIPAVTYRILF